MIVALIDDIWRRFADYYANATTEEARGRAAVLIPLFYKRGELHVVPTTRGDGLSNHCGEVSFPGRSLETSDFDLTVTALRESNEEIGLYPDDVEIIGRVDDIITISHYHVTPFVGAIDPAVCPYEWCCQEREVAEVLEVPLS